jgi:hypothetical protein
MTEENNKRIITTALERHINKAAILMSSCTLDSIVESDLNLNITNLKKIAEDSKDQNNWKIVVINNNEIILQALLSYVQSLEDDMANALDKVRGLKYDKTINEIGAARDLISKIHNGKI